MHIFACPSGSTYLFLCCLNADNTSAHLCPGTWCCTSALASLNQSPLIYGSTLAAKQGGHLDFRSHCAVLDLPDPELFSSQTRCWGTCRDRAVAFCAITEVPQNHWLWFRVSLCKLLLALFQRGYNFPHRSGAAEKQKPWVVGRGNSCNPSLVSALLGPGSAPQTL